MPNHFDVYIKALAKTSITSRTELTNRTDLENLLNAIKENKIEIVHEAKNEREKYGRPDFVIKKSGRFIGYLENKRIGEDLSKIVKSQQIKNYNASNKNIIITDYLDWVWLRDLKIISRARLCDESDLHQNFALDQQKVKSVEKLIINFLSTAAVEIGRSRDLAEVLSVALLLGLFLLVLGLS